MSNIDPTGINCPHSATCLKHRAVTMGLSIAASLFMTLVAGCTLTWSGFGVNFKWALNPPYTTSTQPAPAPVNPH